MGLIFSREEVCEQIIRADGNVDLHGFVPPPVPGNDQSVLRANCTETYTRIPLLAQVKFKPRPPAFKPMIIT
jgi:hypothetical protein